MANKTIGFGIALIVLGLAGYAFSGGLHWSPLIPALFGVPLLVLGFLARNAKRRKLIMHIAVAVALVGFAGSLQSLIARAAIALPWMIVAQSLMVSLTGIYVALCVKSFIDARRPKA